MLSQLPTLKLRLSIPDTDTTQDSILTSALEAVSARFDKETNRTLARTVDFKQEFDTTDMEILAACYPIESVSRFELKTSETTGWQQIQPTPDFLISSSCIISLSSPLGYCQSAIANARAVARITYTGGFVSPGTEPQPGQTPLPPDLEQAALEQVAFWYQSRDTLGLKTIWPRDGAYKQLAQLPLLISVQSVLQTHARWLL